MGHDNMTGQSPGLHTNSGQSSSSSRPMLRNSDDSDSNNLEASNLDKDLLNDDPLGNNSDTQLVIYICLQ